MMYTLLYSHIACCVYLMISYTFLSTQQNITQTESQLDDLLISSIPWKPPVLLLRGGYRGVALQSTALEIRFLQATEFQKLPDYSLQFHFFVLYSLRTKIWLNSTVYRVKIRPITVYGISITPPHYSFVQVTWNRSPISLHYHSLRLLAIHEAGKQWSFTLCLIFLLIHNVSKLWTFKAMDDRGPPKNHSCHNP